MDNASVSGYRGMIFDLDGTLLDTITDITNAINHALSTNGLPLVSAETVRMAVGSKDAKLIDSVMLKGTDASAAEKAYRAFAAEYAVHPNVESTPFPGILDALRALRLAGFTLGIATDKNHVLAEELVCSHFGALVDGVCGRGEGVHGKPAPDTLLGALDILDLTADECLYVGDTLMDYEAARAAGVDVVLVNWGYGSQESLEVTGAPLMNSVDELLQYILNGAGPASENPTPESGTAAIILAAGLSTRMGRSKPLLPLGDKTVIECTVDKVASLVDKVIVVTGYLADEVEECLKDTGVTCVRNPVYENGEMFDSVKAGLSALQDLPGIERVFVTPCDAPLIPENVFRLLMTSSVFPVVPSFDGKQGHPLLIPISLIDDVLSYPGDGGLEACLRACGMAPIKIPVDDDAILVNMNTPDDYERVCRTYLERA